MAKKNLEGTSMSAAHIGADPSARLSAMVKDDELVPVVPVATAGAEASNAIAVDIQLVDADAKTLKSSRRLLCQALDKDMEPSVEAGATLAETGAGAEVSTSAKPGLLITTDDSGAAQVTVTDASGSLADTMYLKITPVDGLGSPALVALTFA